MDVPELKLTGNVKQNSVNVNGTLKGNSYMQWTIPGLHFALGPNSADIKGELGVKELNLDAAIDAPGWIMRCRDWAAWQKESLKSAVR